MKYFILLFLLLLLMQKSAHGQFLEKTELHIFRVEYIKVFHGSSMRPVLMRLDFESNTTYFHDIPIGLSKTFKIHSHSDGAYGSEIFKIGKYPLRLQLAWGKSPAYDERLMLSGPAHQGSIGMAKGGVLWRYWTKYTLAPSTMILGGRDVYLQEDPEFYGPVMSLSNGCIWQTIYSIHVDGASAYTYVPPVLYTHPHLDLEFTTVAPHTCVEAYAKLGISLEEDGCHDSFVHTLGEQDQTLRSASGFEYHMVLPNVHEPYTLRLGRYAMSGMVLYVDLMHDVFTLSPAYRIAGEESNLYESSHTRSFDISWIGALVLSVSVMWLLDVNSKTGYFALSVESKTYFCMNAFFWVFMLFYMPRFADGSKFIIRATRSEVGRWIARAQIGILISAWLVTAFTIRGGRENRRWFKPTFETIAAFCLWASIAFSYDENGTLAWTCIVETIVAYVSSARALKALLARRYLKAIYNLCFFVWHTTLSVFFCIYPLLRRNFRTQFFSNVIVVLYVIELVGLSSAVVFYTFNKKMN